MKYGYARVSTDEQNTALQLAALQKAGMQDDLQPEFEEPRHTSGQL